MDETVVTQQPPPYKPVSTDDGPQSSLPQAPPTYAEAISETSFIDQDALEQKQLQPIEERRQQPVQQQPLGTTPIIYNDPHCCVCCYTTNGSGQDVCCCDSLFCFEGLFCKDCSCDDFLRNTFCCGLCCGDNQLPCCDDCCDCGDFCDCGDCGDCGDCDCS